VAAYPLPELIRGINAFTLGAREVNPDAQVRVVWTKSWYDPATEKEAAKSLLDVGADVIAQHVDSPAPQEAAQEEDAYSIGYNTDMSSFAPKAQLTSAVWHWGELYTDIVKEVQKGTWKSEDIWAGIKSEVIGIAPFGPMVPEKVREEVLSAKEDITEGDLDVFAGPLKDQNGNIRVPGGKSMTDDEIWGMDWFVQGVIGTTE
jgi:basic membrane protein A